MYRIAIVGRPNVGKSTLFNRLCRIRKAIVGDEPGITRDRIYGTLRIGARTMEVLDTGGMVPDARETIPSKILEQVGQAISESDLLLMIVDGRAGITPLDEQLLPVMRKSGKPFWVLVNKADTSELETLTMPFYAFGAEEVFPISAEHDRGIGLLIDSLEVRAGERLTAIAERNSDEIAVAVVGRPNVGKSSLVNRLLGIDRAIVSDIPGTTRDAIDTVLKRDGIQYRIIDTAGIRRKGKTEQGSEKISVIMARKNLERADVAVLLLDGAEGVTKLDAAIGGYASESGCSVIIVANKWDLVIKDEKTIEKFTDDVRRRMKYLNYAPILTISAVSGQRVSKIFDMILNAREARRIRISTGTLNNLFVADLEKELKRGNPNQTLGIRYITQVESSPPTFVVFTTGHKPMYFSTERFLQNQLREKFGFFAAPIRIRQRLKEARVRGGRS